MNNTRNFCIIAHIDHGKSTLADRLLEYTNTIEKRDMIHAQMLDSMELEQERGITIKLQPVRMIHVPPKEKRDRFPCENYILNLIDTPGHVDFYYEVSRSLAACEGAVLVVDATQGIQAQTLANVYMAMEHNLEIIAVVNKIDLPAAEPEKRAEEIEKVFGIPKEEVIFVSAKEGTNIDLLVDRIIEKVPPPATPNVSTAKALIFDSVYDTYRGVVAYVRVKEGEIKNGETLYFLHNKKKFEALEVGYFKPKYVKCDCLKPGEIGYIVTGQKSVGDARVGDTVWKGKEGDLMQAKPLPGYKKVTPYVYASIYTIDSDNYRELREALEKLSLNDASLQFEPERSNALGFGFRCGFLGLLHMDIVQERLEREYDLSLIVTAPSVVYRIVRRVGEEIEIATPSDLPDPNMFIEIKEPWLHMEIVTPAEYVGPIMKICTDRRGLHKNMQYLNETRVILEYEIPLSTVIIDFYDALKSVSQGYASVSYEFLDYRASDLVKLDILVAGDRVDPLAHIVHRSESQSLGRSVIAKLKDIIPKHQFQISIQAAIGGKIIARENISAMRKDVIAKLYGGDRTRKDKLLKKQKAGKKRLKKIGKIDMPQEAFLAILKKD